MKAVLPPECQNIDHTFDSQVCAVGVSSDCGGCHSLTSLKSFSRFFEPRLCGLSKPRLCGPSNQTLAPGSAFTAQFTYRIKSSLLALHRRRSLSIGLRINNRVTVAIHFLCRNARGLSERVQSTLLPARPRLLGCIRFIDARHSLLSCVFTPPLFCKECKTVCPLSRAQKNACLKIGRCGLGPLRYGGK